MEFAVSFDVGGTLVEPWPSVGEVYASVAREEGLGELDPVRIERQFGLGWKARGMFDYSTEAWQSVVQASLHGLTSPEEIDRIFPKLYQRFAEPRAWRIYPDVLPTLEQLRSRGVRLLVISNWDRRLIPLLRDLDLLRYFSSVTVSGELGVHKPDPRIFASACRQIGLPPQQLLHVGDSVREDLEGARNAGLHAAHLDRHRDHSEASRWHTLEESVRFVDSL